jgi:hypothetical protein
MNSYATVNERLPYEIGWKKSEVPIELNDLIRTFGAIQQATSFPPPPPDDDSIDIFM